VMLRWTPTDRFTLDGLYLKQKLDTGGTSRFTGAGTPAWPNLSPALLAATIASGPPGPPVPLPGLPALTPTDDFVNADITNNQRDDDVELFGGTAAYQFDFGTATVSASFFDHDIIFRFDSTPVLLFFGVPAPGATIQPQSYETTMVEARFASSFDGPLNFVTGFYYQKDENDFQVQVPTLDGNGNGVAFNPLNSNDFFGGGTIFFARDRSDEIKQKAVYGEATLDYKGWQLVAGLRAFEVELESVQQTLHNFGGASGPVAGTQIGTNFNGNAIGLIQTNDNTIRPKVSLSYNVMEDVMLYALYSEGFRVGGINNGNQPFAAGIPATFSSDEVNNYEFGIKSRWLDNRLQVNVTGFLIDWNDIQVEPRDPVGNIPFTTNGGKAEVNGIEWALDWLPLEELELSFTGTYYISHELTQDQPVLPGASSLIIAGLDGDEIPNIPDVQLFGSAKYRTNLFGRPLTLIGDVTFRGDSNTEFRANSLFNLKLDSYVIGNIIANVEINQHFTVGAYIKNIGDELAVQDGIATFQDPASLVAARPRTFGATIKWTY
ncbi:MAG: TonB-dependent receptor, partial [Gammaproteobacteria bacterium]